MYDKRIKICIAIAAAMLAVCILRLTQMQLLPNSSVRDEIAELKRKRGRTQQLRTLRGRILDRNNILLASDEPTFQICINYSLSSCLDQRVRKAKLLKSAAAARNPSAPSPLVDLRKSLDAELAEAQKIVDKCACFGVEKIFIEAGIREINDGLWNLRTFLAWRRNNPDPNIIAQYDGHISRIPLSVAMKDFRRRFPDENARLRLIDAVSDIPEMNRSRPLLELKTDNDIFTAQIEFMGADGIEILPRGERYYHHAGAAAQTIGWVGPATQKQDLRLFEHDRLLSYLDGEVCGREDGVEYVCEPILRGRRGEDFFDIDKQLVSHTETRFGQDLTLTLDIELQKTIQQRIADPCANDYHDAGAAAVVLDVATGDILALVSMPTYDLNFVRTTYGDLVADPARPLINRAVNKRYPPGSVAKPIVLIAGLESGKITPDRIIPCPAAGAPSGWPNCWIYNQYRIGHDASWPNIARNAVKGSCNIYFSHLADLIDPPVLQRWLYDFGYGRNILDAPLPADPNTQITRSFRQTAGVISNRPPATPPASLEDLPPLGAGERRWFGIGQGNLRVTPLQVANAMAAIARKGIYKPPRLFLDDPKTSEAHAVPLAVSAKTIDVLLDGMHAVVNENQGTANSTFKPVLADLARASVKVYGKTGSTEGPETAWFAGFAKDAAGRAVSVAVVVETGQSGASDAAPIARDIILFAIDAGYLGSPPQTPETPR